MFAFAAVGAPAVQSVIQVKTSAEQELLKVQHQSSDVCFLSAVKIYLVYYHERIKESENIRNIWNWTELLIDYQLWV